MLVSVGDPVSSAEGGSEVVRLPQRTPFTMVDNPIIRAMDDYVALGMYVDMLSYPPGWRLNMRELARTRKQGRAVLTAAMNELISRGLVFRIRYQQPSGQWATRTYVCSTPVTLAELQELQRQYRRCIIETTEELTAALEASRPSAAPAEPVQPPKAESAGSQHPDEADPPSTRFPTLGEPTPGHPTPGDPAAGDPTHGQPGHGRREPQGLDPRPKTQPPPPSPTNPPERYPDPERTENDPEVEEATSRIEQALTRAWPTLGRRDLSALRPGLVAALSEHTERGLIKYLAGNTEGAKHPGKLLAARLQNLPPAAPPPRASETPWCGFCESADYRWIQRPESHTFSPCPRCSPQAVATQSVRAS